MASPEALAIKEQLRLLSEMVGGAQSVEEQRAQYEMAASMMTVAPDGVAWTEVDAGGVPAMGLTVGVLGTAVKDILMGYQLLHECKPCLAYEREMARVEAMMKDVQSLEHARTALQLY